MNKKKRILRIVSLLKKEYPQAETELKYETPWQLVIAVILSAMTTDISVNKAAPNLFNKYPKPADLANAKLSSIEKIIGTINFYKTKAKNIRAASQKLISEFGGKVPNTVRQLMSLPGVGRKSANVILHEAFGISQGIVVDTHVRRLSRRLGLTSHTDPKKIEDDLMKIIPKKDWGAYGITGVLHGRYICTSRKPKCGECALSQICPSAFKIK